MALQHERMLRYAVLLSTVYNNHTVLQSAQVVRHESAANLLVNHPSNRKAFLDPEGFAWHCFVPRGVSRCAVMHLKGSCDYARIIV